MSPRVAAAACLPLLAGCGSSHAHVRQARVAAVTLLPDLVERPPAEVIGGVVRYDGRNHYSVGFDTRVANRGRGILLIRGHRRPGQPVMVADQLIDRVEAPPLVVKGVGWLRYHHVHGHDHWHLLPFQLYQLRTADGRRVLAHARKEGFCIGSSGNASRPLRTPPTGCGIYKPHALSVAESLQPGEWDMYPGYLTGQSLPLDGLRAGRYYIVIWVNIERRLRESNYANDVGSTLVRITYAGGLPRVKALASCRHAPPCR